jgi:polar amino acid transport system ATP-binding protein
VHSKSIALPTAPLKPIYRWGWLTYCSLCPFPFLASFLKKGFNMKLEIKQLVKKFGTQRAIAIDDLNIESSTLAILGPSGSGKSTLLRMIAGLTYPDSGTISINDQPIIFAEKELRQYRKSLGIVFQSYNLFPHLTALENIVLPLVEVQNMPKDEADFISMELLKRFGLDKHAHKKPYTLSGGQVQRVALIRAIATHPKLLILDEPTSALDPLMTAEVLELIIELKNDQVLFIAEGRLLEKGSTEKVFEHPNSQQAKEYMSKVLAY